jgi:putative membrane protein
MLRMGSKRAGLALVLGAAVAMTACRKNDSGGADTGMVNETGMAAAADTGMAAAADTGMAATPAPLSDANIVYILDNANMLDSTAGSIAATKGTSADVRDFGKTMMGEHHSLRKQGEDLAKKLGITPEAPANDDSKASYDKTMSMLNGAAKGKDFDKAYVDNEVTYHQTVLQTVTTAMGAAQNAELKNLIQKAAPTIQAHLDRAKSIQAKMK